ncbi:MAG: dihydroorotate dehydrogenase electron transfer subunit [Clostridiales bacterium]|nr:dihydroorotate dehydrogenase electron transfer subunit [Clostridiales bacterium]
MKQGLYTVIENKQIAERTYLLRLSGDTSETGRPGTFVNIRLDGFYLRRPISVCDSSNNTLTLIYKVVGAGTEALAATPVGVKLDLLTGLGNGYDITSLSKGSRPLLVGGGCGSPPLYLLAKTLIAAGVPVSVILGFNRRSEVFFEEEFRALGVDLTITTTDGSYGKRGFVTDAMGDVCYDCIFACGPEPMLRAVYEKSGDISGQFGFEERMACGFGVCMGCSCRTKYGPKRICRDGPVLSKEEIIW